MEKEVTNLKRGWKGSTGELQGKKGKGKVYLNYSVKWQRKVANILSTSNVSSQNNILSDLEYSQHLPPDCSSTKLAFSYTNQPVPKGSSYFHYIPQYPSKPSLCYIHTMWAGPWLPLTSGFFLFLKSPKLLPTPDASYLLLLYRTCFSDPL